MDRRPLSVVCLIGHDWVKDGQFGIKDFAEEPLLTVMPLARLAIFSTCLDLAHSADPQNNGLDLLVHLIATVIEPF